MKRIISILLLSILPVQGFSTERGLIDLAETYYHNREYYNSITECLRYQHLYPEGSLYPQSLLISGKSYFRGGNRERGLLMMSNCYNNYTSTPEGETALFYSGLMRLESGSYLYAVRSFLEYNYVYSSGIYKEEVLINLSLTYTLAESYTEAEKRLKEYSDLYPSGKLKTQSEELSAAIENLKARPRKNIYAAGIFSALIPGSGYIYTGDYKLAMFSMLTNGALIYGIYDGYRKKSRFQMIFFSVIEFSFFNYSVFGSIKSADEYNRGTDLKREALIGIKTGF